MSDAMTYIDSDPELILSRMESIYYENGGSALWPGDEKQIFLQTLAYAFSVQRAELNAAAISTQLDRKTGVQLNSEGESRGVERIAAVKATVEIEATFAAGDYAIPERAQFTADGLVYYEAISKVPAVSSSGMTIAGDLTAIVAGAAGNSLAAGKMLTPVDSIPGLISIVTVRKAYGGSDEESDDAYRERIRTSGAISVAGPAKAYEALARRVSTQIIDAKAKREQPQGVLVTILCEEGTEDLTGSVKATLSADDVRPLNDNVTVQNAEIVPYSVTVKYKAEAGEEESIAAAIRDAAADYQAWQDRKIGRSIDAYQLLARCVATGAARVELKNAPSYTTLSETQAAKGTIAFEEMT